MDRYTKLFVLLAIFALFAPMQTAQAIEYIGPDRENTALQPLAVVDGWGDVFAPFAPGFDQAGFNIVNVLRVNISARNQGVIVFGPRQNVSAGQNVSVQVTVRTLSGAGSGIALHLGLLHESGRTIINEVPSIGAGSETVMVSWQAPKSGSIQTILQVAGRNWNGLAEVEVSKPLVTIGNVPVEPTPTVPPVEPTPPPSGADAISLTSSHLVVSDVFNKFFARPNAIRSMLDQGAQIMLVGEDTFGANFWFPGNGIVGTVNHQAGTVSFPVDALHDLQGTILAGIAVVPAGSDGPDDYAWINQALFTSASDRLFWRKVSWKENDWFIALKKSGSSIVKFNANEPLE